MYENNRVPPWGYASPSISLVGSGQLVKMLITFEPHYGINMIKFCLLIHFNIVWATDMQKRGRSFAKKFDRRPRLPHNCPRLSHN